VNKKPNDATLATLLALCFAAFCGCGSTVIAAPASTPIQALMGWYSQTTGLFTSTGWWNSANAITVVVNYSRVYNTTEYWPTLSNTFAAAQKTNANFINKYYDDEGWWALAWIDAYDLTANPAYLSMAETIFADMTGGWDTATCGGGIWWNKSKTYKNAIANELFLSVAAHLANRVTDPTLRAQYLNWAQQEWQWFYHSGMINASHLINDGLKSTNPAACINNNAKTWTYNQGVILAGLVELNHAQPDPTLLPLAAAIANATIAAMTDAKGVLHEPCEPSCGGDGTQFKGIFVRNLMALNDADPQPAYKTFSIANAAAILASDQAPNARLGLVWSGPFDSADAARQSSALDALIASSEMQH
jgi:predicted alpha-1,6-mannanase (GH76 family)